MRNKPMKTGASMCRMIALVLLAEVALGLGNLSSRVSAADLGFMKQASRQVDKLVEQYASKGGAQLNSPATDEEFLRRTYLNIVGRIPTEKETRQFLDSEKRGKRTLLIDWLLSTDGYVSHHYNYWADILRVKSRLQGIRGLAGEPYIKWIKQSLADNKPYDKMVYEMVTSAGDTWDPQAGATGFYRRDKGMPLDHMALMMQTFLGTQMACAQCHNHPFDKWTQKEFYEMAAFTSMPNNKRNGDNSVLMELRNYYRKSGGLKNQNSNFRAVSRVIRDTLAYSIPDAGVGTVRLPKDYQYEDAKPREMIKARTVFGNELKLEGKKRNTGNSRDVLADWMTDPENPRFTKIIANRLWKKVMGYGLIEPVDDIREDTVASNPKLMTFLEKTMVDCGYDMKAFMRILYDTRTYQRKSSGDDIDPSKPYYFAGPVIQRMSAEQLWDSMMVLKNPEFDTYKNPHNVGSYALYNKLNAMNADELIAFSEKLIAENKGKRINPNKLVADLNGVDETLMNPAAPVMAVMADMQPEKREMFVAHRAKMQTLQKKIQAAKQKDDKATVRSLMLQAKALKDELGLSKEMEKRLKNAQKKSQKKRKPAYVRASELDQPAPPAHFLRQFGSSDREVIENASTEATTPQALQLLNGFVDKTLLADGNATVLQNVGKAKTTRGKLESIYFSVWNRAPRESEIEHLMNYVQTNGRTAYREIIWAMLNSHEFMFIQ